jgi:cell division protein FtsL
VGARIFVLSAGVLAAAFLTALLYLRFATSIAAGGYDLHDLEARRNELQRQNGLLQLQIDRLDAPARIEAEAQRLGLVKAALTLFVTTGPSVTLR